MDENFDWTNGIVAIYGDKGMPVGTGFVVSAGGHIATCAHVLAAAAWPYQRWDAPVQVRFKATKRFARAVVLEGCYQAVTEGDLAILALQEPLPAGVEVLPLTAARSAVGHKVSTWGYPKFRATGIGGSGEVVNLIPGDRGELIQIESTNTTRGYSGGPVWDASLCRVIGLIQQGLAADDELGRHAFTNLAAPAEALIDLCPGRLTLTPPDDPLSEEDRLALQAYLGMVARQGEHLPLAPLDPAGQESAYLTLAQVFVGLDAGEATRPSPEPGKIISYTAALGHIADNPQLILLGDPGSGKTTLLRFLSLCLAQAALGADGDWLGRLACSGRLLDAAQTEGERLDRTAQAPRRDDEEAETVALQWPAGVPLPVLVTLRDFAREHFDPESSSAIWDHVVRRLEAEKLAEAVAPLRRRALDDRVIFLLDGIDEVPLNQRSAVWDAIAALKRGPFGGNRWLATCRILSFSADEAPPGVPNQTLLPLTESRSTISSRPGTAPRPNRASWQLSKLRATRTA